MAESHGAMGASRHGGFSLIEITLVLLIVGVGLVALLGLFPIGLRQSTFAVSDTTQAMFADQVLNRLHANASTITNWSDWSDFEKFKELSLKAEEDDPPLEEDAEKEIPDYLESGITIKYKLSFMQTVPPFKPDYVRRVFLRCTDRKDSDLDRSPVYCTDFVFMGHVPE
jgi:prepilin-type N-terminal cleavage/methylation domain-containing protein